MIKENDLSVVVALDFYSLGAVTGWVDVWVHVYYFSVSFVSEQEPLIIVSIHPEIGRVIQCGVLCIPVEEAQVRRLW